jgi:hypothetical protein
LSINVLKGQGYEGVKKAQMDKVVSELEESIQKLVIDYKTHHYKIKMFVYEAVKSIASTLPKEDLVFNSSHGKFSYSSHFTEQKQKQKLIEEEAEPEDAACSYRSRVFTMPYWSRISDVPIIIEYGKQCKTMFPHIAKQIALYNINQLGCLFNILGEAHQMECTEIPILEKYQMELIDDDAPFGNCDTTPVGINIPDIKVYTRLALQEWVDNRLVTLSTALDDLKGELNLQFGDCLNKAELLWNAYTICNHHKHNKVNHSRSFGDTLAQDHQAVWHCQSFYNPYAMYFLEQHPDFCFHSGSSACSFTFETPEEINMWCTDTEIGLLFASGPGCKLKLGKVPQYLDWFITNYEQGIERVVLVP